MVKSIRKIYLDSASSAVAESSNPGAIHDLGTKEKNKLEQARAEIAKLLNAHKNEVIFTSGATESNNLAILGMPPGGVVTTNIEHASVLETCKHRGAIFVSVEPNGIIDPKKIKKVLTKNTVLVSVGYANNEIGTIQPIREIAKEIRHFNKTNNSRVYFHVDATQAINYLPINVEQLGVDLMSWNGAKIYGPKGVGALYVRKGTPISKIMFGGDQEYGLRPGTENVAGAVALAKAMTDVEKIKDKEVKRLSTLRDYFIKKLSGIGFELNGDVVNRLPNNVNVTIANIPSDLLVIELSARGIMASAKSACKAGDGKASHVIQAILSAQAGNPKIKDTDGYLRFSLGQTTTQKDVNETVKALSQILIKLKKWYNN